MSWWSWAWIGWFSYFAAVEGYALYRSAQTRKAGGGDNHDTLSEHVWAWFGVNRRGTGIYRHATAWAKIRRVILGAFMLWLSIHFLTGGAYF